MTANRPRKTGPLEETALNEALFTGAPQSGTGWLLDRRSHLWRPPTDVYETEEQIVVQVEIAGVQSADFSVSLNERRLSISGVRVDPGPERRAYHQMEVHFGEFRSDVDLPGSIDENSIEVEYSDGFLRLILPKLKRPPGLDLQ